MLGGEGIDKERIGGGERLRVYRIGKGWKTPRGDVLMYPNNLLIGRKFPKWRRAA